MDKRGLGRGLAALISENNMEESGGQVREIPVEQVTANPYQPRTLFDPVKMEELVASIREHGVLQPILLRQMGHERYQLVAGERRFRAAQAAGLSTLPALVKDITEREQLEMAVIENVQREDIGALEAARAYRRLMDEFGLTQEAVSQRVGKSRSSIANTLRLLNLPEMVQDSIERGEITEGHGLALMIAEDDTVILHAWQSVIKKRLSVKDTERYAKDLRAQAGRGPVAAPSNARLSGRENGKPNGRGAQSADPNESDVADKLQQALGTKVTLRRSPGGAGKIEIEFYSAQELDRLLELLIHGRYES